MAQEKHIPSSLFEGEHYLGKPAEANQKIIYRRLRIMSRFSGFFDNNLTAVEIGCGNGASTIEMAKNFKNVVALEYFDGHKDAFYEFAKAKNVNNCEFRQHNIETQPLLPPVERLVSLEVIEHLNDENSVANYAQSLVQGGLAVISVPNKWWIFEQHGARLPILPWNRVPFFSWLPRFIHERYANARIYTKSRITKLLKKHGFEVLETVYITAPMDVLPEGWLKNLLCGTLLKNDTTKIPFFSTSIMLFARKK